GSSSSSTTSAPASTTASTTASTGTKANGTPINVLVIATLKTPAGAIPETIAGAKAAAMAINNAGGVGGRPINIIPCDDQESPTGATTCARRAVAMKVTAVQMTSNFGAQVFPILSAASIPVVGTQPFSAEDNINPDSWPLTPSSDLYHY